MMAGIAARPFSTAVSTAIHRATTSQIPWPNAPPPWLHDPHFLLLDVHPCIRDVHPCILYWGALRPSMYQVLTTREPSSGSGRFNLYALAPTLTHTHTLTQPSPSPLTLALTPTP